LGLLDLPVRKGLQEQMALLGRKDPKEIRETRDPRDPSGLLDLLGQMVP